MISYKRTTLPEPLITEDEIQKKVNELALQISSDYATRELVVVCVLKGAWVFMADLVRRLSLPVRCDFVRLRSYQGTETTGKVEMLLDTTSDLEGKDLLIVEDIVDTGITMDYLLSHMQKRGVRSVEVCALLDKPSRRVVDLEIRYVGFTIPDKFIVGYGLDFDEKFRNLPYIGVV
ncbi:MAG: Hypoxanthine phosphoribosyl transferase [Candidatus Syntrophoarchaeum caldarius]|uniref:hypoxanthine phosphoribosyltransferase n=1 Tax=Candidatus Syntropharchaeum caldarium TaxID=1838285 RepID=A0A1F2PBT6_9EURY|nr:MAG: Hypoxanthine phosphoribosyl transferase [Candidatus Syntrophoarchaeum caldarius]